MAVTTSAVIGIGSGIATSIQGFTSASKARTAQQNADNEAKRMMMNARKRAEQNEYGELSLPLEAFEAEFEANLAADRQAIEALQEGDSRALAAGVGRVGAQQNQEAQATRMNMADEMFGLEKMKADAKEQQKQQLIAMDVGEAKMQDQKAREAAEARRMGIEAGFQGIGQVAQGVGDMAPLYGRSMNDKRAQALMNSGNMKLKAKMAGVDVNDELALFDWISSQEITGEAGEARPWGFRVLEWCKFNFGLRITMAKDFSISSKVLDTDKYVYREERDLAKTQVDWGTISKNLTDTINTVRDDRETQKAEIEKANTEEMNRAGEFDQYNNKTLNESVLEGSEWAKNALSVQMDLVRRGLVTPGENQRYQQRVSDSFTFLKKNLSSFEADFNENNRRAEEGESTTLEQAINGSVAGLGVLKNWKLSGNAATGELAYVRAGNDPKTGEPYDANNPANQASLGTVGVRATNRTDYTSTTEMAQAEVGALAEVISSTLLDNQAVRTVEDWRDLDKNEDMITGLVATLTSTRAKIASIAQDKLGFTPETYNQSWSDEELAEDPDKVRLIPDPSGSGDLIPDYSPEQIARVEEAARLSLESQIDQKIKTVKGFDPDSPAKAGARKEQSSSFGYIDQTMEVITGDNTEFNSAASSLKTAWDKANPDNPMDEDKPIDRSDDPNYILVNYANGEVEKIAKFELDAKGNQILNEDGQPIPVADELLVQNLLTKVAPVTGSTQGLMDEYLQENPDGLVDRGGREETTSYQGTGDKTIEDTSLGNKMILVEGSPMNVGDRLLAISQQEGSDEEQLAEYTTVINSILSSELKDITANFEVSSEDITTRVGNRNFITVTIDGVPTEIEFDTVDDSAKLQSEVQKAINAAKKKIRDKRSKSSTSNNSGGKVRT